MVNNSNALLNIIFKYVLIILLLLFSVPETYAKTENDSTKKVKIAAIPIINYNASQGALIGALGQAFYKLNAQDTISPSSSTGLFGIYTTNSTFFTALFQNLYWNEDKWRAKVAAGFGQMNFQYWQQLPINDGAFVDFSTDATFALARIERKVFKQLYFGVEGTLSKAETGFDLPDFVPDSIRYDSRNMNNIGILLNYDLRDHQMNPYSGFNVSFKNLIYKTWLNSGNDFNKIELVYNHYYQIKNERNIIVSRFKTSIASGDVPFQGQSVVGQDDIRGYTAGKYRNNQIYALQAEYRWRFYKKWGMVGFAGLASAVESASDLFSTSLLPGAGVGLRYMMIPSERINVGFDVAAGKDDWGLYFRIGESFGR
ncbi:BamA/TamA family outer membrane protein [Saccharicrinis aurantiacus]|uniref:BamA/TamA family outer membrane protein n=1 Tax=Saccharicrinis aurantiacus TaxID=1849719 RepID=UPI00094FD78C|nr:BamA/TamA family outer membrane protein [Saccharicrinis aurantiacus]